MVKVGYTIWYGDHKYLEDRIKRVYELGFNYIELSLDYPWPYINADKLIESICKIVREYGLRVAIHSPWRDIRLASPVSEIREASLKVVIRVLNLTSRLDPLYFNLHMMSEEAIKFNSVKRDVLKAVARSLEDILSEADKLGIDITIENNVDGIMSEPEHFISLRNIVDREFYICLDIAHALIPYLKRGDEPPNSILDYWISSLYDFTILTIHLSDIEKVGPCIFEHLIFGHGILNLNQILSKIKHVSGLKYVLLEIFWCKGEGDEKKTIQLEDLREYIKIIKIILRGL